MKTHFLYCGAIVFASLIIAAALLWPRNPAPSRSNNGKQLQELQNRISQLENKAASLEKELGRVRDQSPKQSPTVIYTPASEAVPAVTTEPVPAKIPPGWKPFEFNGMTYYFTPLGQGREVSVAAGKKSQVLSLALPQAAN